MSKIMTIIDEENNIEQVEVLNILYLEVTEKNYVFYLHCINYFSNYFTFIC